MKDQIIEIDTKDLPLLRDLYKPGSSRNYITYVTIDTYIQWIRQDPNAAFIKFYCLNGDISRGTFVATDRGTAYPDTFNESDDELYRLLLLLDYSKGYFFISLNDRTSNIVRQVIKEEDIELLADNTNLNYFLPKEKALELNLKLPDGIQLKPLKNHTDVVKAHSAYPFSDLVPLGFFLGQAKYNPTVGAYTKDGTLVAWVFRYTSGLLLALQTDKDHFGHGYGSLVTKAISKQIAEMGHDCYASIFEENTPSRKLFEKLGYQSIGTFHWICTKFSWTDNEFSEISL